MLTARNLDLRRRVKYKQRRVSTKVSTVNKAYRVDRNYADFQKLIKEQPDLNIVEMDTVMGRKGGKMFLTMMFRKCSLMLIFLLESNTQSEVKRIFDELTTALGIDVFTRMMPVILTDGGPEFQNPTSLEFDEIGSQRTKIYYWES